MYNIVGIMLGGGIGSLLRFLVMKPFNHSNNKHIGTFLVNTIGSFLLGGIFATALSSSTFVYKFIVVGIIASFTTFSTYEFDSITLLASQRYKEYFKYTIASCFVCLFSLYMGIFLYKFIKIKLSII